MGRISGKITSGHQLFGSVTFNMFWTDGYRALDALDDNRDGTLADGELEALAVSVRVLAVIHVEQLRFHDWRNQ